MELHYGTEITPKAEPETSVAQKAEKMLLKIINK